MNRFRRKPNQKGFTMIELMVVVVIVGVLAAVAIPIYGKYIKNARLTEATSRIGEIITAAKAYAQENQTAAGVPTWPPAAGAGIVDLSATENFTYSITAGGGTAATGPITFRGTGIAGSKMAGVTVDITVASITANGGAPVVAGL
jgi:type IV pilus assembly protein PilE